MQPCLASGIENYNIFILFPALHILLKSFGKICAINSLIIIVSRVCRSHWLTQQ